MPILVLELGNGLICVNISSNVSQTFIRGWVEAPNGFEPLTAALQTAPFAAWVRRRHFLALAKQHLQRKCAIGPDGCLGASSRT